MAVYIALFVALTTISGRGDRPALVRLGGDSARGVLVNHTPGARLSDPPDPGRPTVVFVHGFNPVPRAVHFGMGERLAATLGRRVGPAFNLLDWDWNAATFAGLGMKANEEAAVGQGRALAATLWRAGVPAVRIHLVGHSSGSIVVASAARTLSAWHGRPIAQVTMLDPAAFYQELIFDQLGAVSAALRVENYWAPGPSGYGRPVARAGVWNTRVDGPTPYLGSVWPLRSSHLSIVDWYITTAGNPAYPGGFNTSVLLGAGGR